MLDGGSWEQPTLTSNGAWEIDDFAVRGMGSNTYLAFDGTNKYLNKTNKDAQIEIWVKKGIAIDAIWLRSSDNCLPTRGAISYSDDGINYIDCGTWSDTTTHGSGAMANSNNHDVHKYFRITCNSRCDFTNNNADISDVKLVSSDIDTSDIIPIEFDGSTNYAEIPVSLTDISDWSVEITFKTDGDGDNRSEIFLKNCLFGQDIKDSISDCRDFHVDVKNGNLHIYHTNENTSNYDELVDTKINVADGKQHTVKIVSNPSDNGISVYCDDIYVDTVYIKGANKKTVYMPTPCLGANGRIGNDAGHLHFLLYSFKLAKNGKVIAEYEPTAEQTIFRMLKDKSGNSNNASLYGVFHTYASGIPVSATEVLATDTSSTPIAVVETKPDSVSGIPIALCLVNHDSASAEINMISEVVSTTSSGIPTIIAEIKSKNYDFVQPTLTADGKFGEDVFAVRAGGGTQTAWGAFTDDANMHASSINNGSYIDIYTAIPIIVDYIKISSNGNMPAHGILEYSDDGEVFTPCGKWKDRDEKGTWDVAFCDDSNGHCYWRLKSTADSSSAIAKLDIYANKAKYIRKCLIEKVNGVDWRTVALINKTKSNKIFKLNNLSTNKTIVI